MEDDIKQDEKIINERAQHKRNALILLGWLEAEPDYWESQRNKIQVIGTNRTFEKQEDDLKNIRKRKDGRYEYRRTINGQQFQCINRDREIVKRFATKINRQLKESMKKPNSNIKFCDYAEEYFKLYKEPKIGNSAKAEWLTAINFFKATLNKPFKSLMPNDFQRLLNDVSEESQNTAKKMYNKISSICKKAYLSGIITINIGEIIERPEYHENTRRALTLFEQVKFLNFLKKEDEDLQNFCLFCLITSARRQEAFRYKPQDWNKQKMTLFVNGTKTLNAPRTIRITKSFSKILERIGKGFLHTADYYSRKVKEIFIKMGCQDLVFNSLRHTCATNMVYLGIPAEYRKHTMGHSSILITDRVYTNIEVGVSKTRLQMIYKDLYFTDY